MHFLRVRNNYSAGANVLSHQRVKSKFRLNAHKKLIRRTVILILLSGLLVSVPKLTHPMIRLISESSSPLVCGSDSSVDNKSDRIASFVSEKCREHKSTLVAIAKSSQNIFDLQYVNVTKSADDRITVSYKNRTVALLIEADRLRFVSIDGAIYGNATDEDRKHLATLSGVFESSQKEFLTKDDRSLVMSESQLDTIINSIALVAEAKKHAIDISNLAYKKYRGYLIELRDARLSVTIGNGSYEKQLFRLATILKTHTNNSNNILVIELDYDNKAFVTVKHS